MNSTEHSGLGRIRPLIALKSLLRVARNPEDTASGTRFTMALEGGNSHLLLKRFREHPDGRRILSAGSSVRRVLRDRNRLRNMSEGSLGRAYLGFCEEEGLSIDGLADATSAPTETLLARTPEAAFVYARITDQHDLWHVVTGYSRDAVGEFALIAFGYEQLGFPAYRVLLGLATTVAAVRLPEARTLLRQARVRGRIARWLLTEDWEALLPEPLDKVRYKLRLGNPPPYTRYQMVHGRLVAELE